MSTTHALRERRALLAELGQIMQAMKNLAFAELQRIGRVMPALLEARDAVSQALERIRAEAPAPAAAARPRTWLVIGAERGFCGPFNARLAAAVAELARQEPRARLLVAGRRLAGLLEDGPVHPTVIAGCSAIEEVDAVLDAWIGELAVALQQNREVRLLAADAGGTASRRLLPEPELPPPRARQPAAAVAPLRYLPLPALRAALTGQAVRLLLHAGLLASLEQENRWRLAQMQRAQDHLDELSRRLRRREATQRQADITNELETLMSSLDSGFTRPT